MNDAKISWKDVQALFCATAFGGMAAGHNIAARAGMTGIPIVDIENACASSASALRLCFQEIAAGYYDMCAVVGVEKTPKGFIVGSQYESWQRESGFAVTPAYMALQAKRYMHEYGMTPEHLALVSAKNHKNGTLDPFAMYQKELTTREILKSDMVCDPLTLYMLAAPNEGAAAAILCATETAKKYNDQLVQLSAASLKSPMYSSLYTKTYAMMCSSARVTNPMLTTMAAREAYKEANVSPRQIDVAEVEDGSSWEEIIAYEGLEFCNHGEGYKMIERGETNLGSRLPVNTSGGLLSKGDPVGASALGRVIEVVWQLRERAGARQVKGAKTGLCHMLGAGGNCSVVILKS